MAAALRMTGVDCGHERAFHVRRREGPELLDVHGNWGAESSAAAAPFTPMYDTYVVRLTRHPLKVIASALHRGGSLPESREFVHRWLPELSSIDDVLTHTARYWIRWNKLIQADETIRLEDASVSTVERLARIVEPDANLAQLPEPQNASLRVPSLVTWADVAHVTDLREAAAAHGYLE